jgi:hypothetical protein
MSVNRQAFLGAFSAQDGRGRMLRTSLIVVGILSVAYLIGMLVLGPVLVDAAGLRHPSVQTVGNRSTTKYSALRTVPVTKTAQSAPAASSEPEVQITPIAAAHKTEAPKHHKRKHKKHTGSDIQQIWSTKQHNPDEPEPAKDQHDEQHDGGDKRGGDENQGDSGQ